MKLCNIIELTTVTLFQMSFVITVTRPGLTGYMSMTLCNIYDRTCLGVELLHVAYESIVEWSLSLYSVTIRAASVVLAGYCSASIFGHRH
jgi:hypothetical protein